MPAASTNRWDQLNPPEIGNWAPRLRVSVIIPYYDSLEALRRTLIGLAAQTYPAGLTELTVVDDGSPDALVQSDIEDLVDARIVTRDDEGFRLAAARNDGAAAASGDVLAFLDHDMLPDPVWLESHMRWHHIEKRALVLGSRSHVDDSWLTEDVVRDAGASGGLAGSVSEREVQVPEWIEFHLERTANLASPDDDIFRVVTGGNLSLSRDFFDELGGFDPSFVRWGGEDTEFGYRAWVSGALLVPDRDAHCWHQGLGVIPDPSERQSQQVQQRKLAHLIPVPGFRTRTPGRIWRRPRVVAEIQGEDPNEILATARSLLQIPDLVVVIRSDDGLLVEDLGPDPRVDLTTETDLRAHRFSPFFASVPAGLVISEPLLDSLIDSARTHGAASTRDGVAVESRRHVNSGMRTSVRLDETAGRARRVPIQTSRVVDRVKRIRSLSDVGRTVRWLGGAVRRRMPGRSTATHPGSATAASRPRELEADPWSRVVAVDLPDLPATGRLEDERVDLIVTRDDLALESESRHLRIADADDPELLSYPPLEPARALSVIRGESMASEPLYRMLQGHHPDDAPPGRRTGLAMDAASGLDEADMARLEAIRRAVLSEHLPIMRLDQLRRAAGLPAIAPSVSMIVASRRVDTLPVAIEAVLGQSYPEVEVILAAHGVQVPDEVEEMMRVSGMPYEIVPAPEDMTFGSVLAMATRRASGELLAKMDDDDWYACTHIEDLVNAHLLSNADLVGKGAEFVHLQGSDTTIRRFVGGAYSRSPTIAGGAMAITRDAYDGIGGWADVARHVDQALIRDVTSAGGTLFRTHGLGYVLVRHGDHTWQSDERRFTDQAEQTWSGLPDWILSKQPPDQCRQMLSR